MDVVWGPPRCVWARESTAPAQGNQSLSRELRASALCPGLEAQFQQAGEKRGVAGLLLGRTERAARAAELQLCAQARSVQVYELPCTAALSEKVSLLDLLAFASKRSMEGMTVDVKLRVSLGRGKGTTLTFNDIDLSQFSQ